MEVSHSPCEFSAEVRKSAIDIDKWEKERKSRL